MSIFEVKIKVSDGGFAGVAQFYDVSDDCRTGRICEVNPPKEMGTVDRPENGLSRARYKSEAIRRKGCKQSRGTYDFHESTRMNQWIANP